MMNGRDAATSALATYARLLGAPMAHEEEATKASDMITDLLLTFSPEDAAAILHRVERDNTADRTA